MVRRAMEAKDNSVNNSKDATEAAVVGKVNDFSFKFIFFCFCKLTLRMKIMVAAPRITHASLHQLAHAATSVSLC